MIMNIGIVIRQYVLVIIANFTVLQMGLTLGWLSPVLVKLSDPHQSILTQPLSSDEGAWFVAISSITGMIALFYTSSLADSIGRKKSLILSSVPRLMMCVLYLLVAEPWALLVGRSLCGVADFMGISVAAAYASEIASKEIRGGLGTVTQILSAFGSMLMLTVGPFVSYVTINIILTCLTVATFLPMFLLPESPYFLYTKGDTEQAIKILSNLRGSTTEAQEEIKEYALLSKSSTKFKEIIKDIVFLKTSGKVVLITFGFIFTGYNAVTLYLQTVLEMTNTSLRSEISSAIIGCLQLFACICTIFVVDRLGRKPVMLTALCGMAAGLIGLGVFFRITETADTITGFMNYLPLICLVLIIYCYNAGLGSQLWMLMAELFDGQHRAFGISLAVFFASIYTFLTLKYFPSLMSIITPAWTYWTFSICCGLLGVFIIFAVPETKGKHFSEIQRDMGRTDLNEDYKESKAESVYI